MADGTATPKSKLDSLSKEDLIKFVKKQVANLKVAKDQCSEQQQKLLKFEEETKRLQTSYDELISNSSRVHLQADNCSQTDNDAYLPVGDSDKVKFANEHQLRQQVLILRTALNRRRLETEENLHKPCGDSSTYFKDSTDSSKEIRTVEVQTLEIQLLNAGVQCDVCQPVNKDNENEKDNESSVLALELAVCQRTVDALHKEVELKTSELSVKIKESQTLNQELNQLRESFSDVEDDLSKTKSQLKFLENENNDLKFRFHDKEVQLESFRVNCQGLELQLNDAKLELAGVDSKRQQNVDNSEEVIRSLRNHIVSKEQECERLKLESNELSKEFEIYKQKNEKDNDSSMLTLELEDCQRTVDKLQNEFQFKTSELSFKIKENQTLNEELKHLRESFSGIDDNLAKTKNNLNLLENENNDLKFRFRDKEVQLETFRVNCQALELQLNDAKLELAGVYSRHQQNVDNSEEVITSLRRQLASKEQECERLKSESNEMSKEFEIYKVRVHSTLRQKRVDPSEDETSFLNQKLAFEKTINSLREQLLKTNSLYQTTVEDLKRSMEQLDQSAVKCKERETRFEQTIETLRKQITEMRYELTLQKQTHDEFIQSSTVKRNQLKHDFENQVKALVEQNGEKESELHMQITRLEDSLRETRSMSKFKDTGGFVEFDERLTPPLDERKPAEGSDYVDFKPSQSALSDIGRPNSPPFLPDSSTHLDRLLNYDERSDTDVRSITVDYAMLETKVEDTSRRNRHLVEVLAESEANNTRLNEQIRLLKEEIRRLERNQEREKHVANAEYLKNVVMKFVNPKAKDQRSSLVPVLATLLRLSGEEIKLLQELSDEGGQQSSASAGWSGYLHRWSGLT